VNVRERGQTSSGRVQWRVVLAMRVRVRGG